MIGLKSKFATSIALASIYFAFPTLWTKVLAILYNAVNCGDDPYGSLIAYGLAFSSLGDISLEISKSDKFYFMCGLIFFLIGHLFYIKAFFKNCMNISVTAILFSAAYFVAIMSKILPSLEEKEPSLKIPVILYGVVICTMVCLGLTRAFSYHLGISHKSKLYGAVGALIFVVSDSIIAIDKFVAPIEHGKLYVMLTYYSGQLLIAATSWCYDAPIRMTGCGSLICSDCNNNSKEKAL